MRDVLEFWIQCRCSKWPPLASKHCESRRTAAWTTFCNVSSVIAAHNVVMFSHRSSRAIWGWKLLPTIRWRSTPLPSRCQDVSGWNSTWTMDRSKRCCWVSTTVPGSNTSRLLPMGVPKGWCLSEETSYTGWSTRKHHNVVCSYHAGHITERSSCSSSAASTVFGCRWWPLQTPTLNPKFKDISHINFAFV